MSNIMKIRLMRAELFHLDRQTNGRTNEQADSQTKLTVAFRKFAKVP